jgi:hypothetical protein
MEVIIYGVCLGVGLLFTIISAMAGHFFGDADHGGDIGTGGHAEAGSTTAASPESPSSARRCSPRSSPRLGPPG